MSRFITEKLNEEKNEIIPDETKPRYWENHTYVGEVVEIPPPNTSEYLLLDVGNGVVSVDTDVIEVIEEPLSEGDYLKVQTHRSDLLEVNRPSP